MNIALYRAKIGDEKILKYAGVGWRRCKCIGAESGCVRGPKHEDHVWDDEYLVADKIRSNFAQKKGERWAEGDVVTTAKWFNFLFCLAKVAKRKKTQIINTALVDEALDVSRRDCFDMAGDPVNVAAQNGTSYGKLMSILDQDLKFFIFKA